MSAEGVVSVDEENPDREAAVRIRAYYLYLERERDGGDGDELADWLRAEETESESPREVASIDAEKRSAQRERAVKAERPTGKGARKAASSRGGA